MFSRIVSVLAALGLVAPSVLQVEPKAYDHNCAPLWVLKETATSGWPCR